MGGGEPSKNLGGGGRGISDREHIGENWKEVGEK